MEYHVISEAVRLLEEYRSGDSFFLSSPQQTMLAQGTYAVLSPAAGDKEPGALSRRVNELLQSAVQAGHDAPVVVGALTFDPAQPAHLKVPVSVRTAGTLHMDLFAQSGNRRANKYTIRPYPEPKEYMRGVEQGLSLLHKGELRKIVLSRTLLLTSPVPVDTSALLRALASSNPRGYTFAVDLPGRSSSKNGKQPSARGGDRRTLIGASPELLVTRKGLSVTANPLAGSAARSSDPAEDRLRAEALLESAKDLHEHQVVVEAVAAALRPYCKFLIVPPAPSLLQTATMWHLSTVLEGELSSPDVSSLELACALHPTPAVCGTPTEAAREAIRLIEPFDREFFTGMVGWCDLSGDGEWVVTIRCAEVEAYALRLYAGAGVVSGSSPEGELAETGAKFRTMLRAMGLENEDSGEEEAAE
jgi:isochorismate synthase